MKMNTENETMLQCLKNDIESNTTANLATLMEDTEFREIAVKLAKTINHDNYQYTVDTLTDYANNNLI